MEYRIPRWFLLGVFAGFVLLGRILEHYLRGTARSQPRPAWMGTAAGWRKRLAVAVVALALAAAGFLAYVSAQAARAFD